MTSNYSIRIILYITYIVIYHIIYLLSPPPLPPNVGKGGKEVGRKRKEDPQLLIMNLIYDI